MSSAQRSEKYLFQGELFSWKWVTSSWSGLDELIREGDKENGRNGVLRLIWICWGDDVECNVMDVMQKHWLVSRNGASAKSFLGTMVGEERRGNMMDDFPRPSLCLHFLRDFNSALLLPISSALALPNLPSWSTEWYRLTNDWMMRKGSILTFHSVLSHTLTNMQDFHTSTVPFHPVQQKSELTAINVPFFPSLQGPIYFFFIYNEIHLSSNNCSHFSFSYKLFRTVET